MSRSHANGHRASLISLMALVLLWLMSMNVAAAVIDIDASGKIPAAGKMAWLYDPDGKLDLPQVRSLPASAFQSLPGNLSAGFRSGVSWLRLEVRRPAAVSPNWLLEVTPPYTDDLRLYSFNDDGSINEQRTGDWLPFHVRPLQYRNFVFRVDLPEDRPVTLYLRIATRNTMLAAPTFWLPETFVEASTVENLFLGFLFGIVLLLLVSNFVLWRYLKEVAYLHYLIYVASFLLILLHGSGLMHQYVFPEAPIWSDQISAAMVSLSPLLAFNVMWSLLDLAKYMPQLFRIYRAIVWCISMAGLLFIIFGRFADILPVMQMLLLGCIVANVVIGMNLVRKAVPGAIFYMYAFGFVILGTIIRLLRNFGLLPSNLLTEHLINGTVLVHIVMLSVLVSVQMLRLKLERNAAIEAALEATRRNEDELLQRVAERTAELEKANATTGRALSGERQVVADQRQFLSMISHEIRTPLAIIDGAAQLTLLADDGKSSEIGISMEKVRRGVRRLADLIDNCLTEDRLTSGAWQLSWQECNVAELCLDVAASAQIASDSHVIRPALNGLPTRIECDPQLLAIALQNLLDNAIKYTPEHEVITVTGKTSDDGGAIIEITDRGPGIPEELREKIFNRYTRGQGVQNILGAGLGLHLTRHIVELHGGTITIAQPVEGGSSFIICLPAHRA
jgi:signal transduction histidine kinase